MPDNEWRPPHHDRRPAEYDTTGVDPDIAPRLMAMVSPRRFAHCKAVADLAVSLAKRWDLDPDAARRAGLLHDICRENRDAWPALAAREGLRLPDWAEGNWGLLHGPLGGVVAEREFGLPRPWVDGIASHTTGSPHMSREEMVLYVADHACEGRRDPQVPHWRALAHDNLEAATAEMLGHLLQSLLTQGKPLWPPAVEARNGLLLARRLPPSPVPDT